MAKKYFVSDDAPSNSGKYMVRVNIHNLPITSTSGSYNVLAARLFGLNYADYLRMCRDLYGAEILGKGTTYPVAYFSTKHEVELLVKELNKRCEILLGGN